MKMKVTVRCKSAEQIIRAHGLDRNGDVQKQWTGIVYKRLPRYMPFRTGTLSEEKLQITGPAEIRAITSYAHYQYAGVVWIDPKINAAGFLTKDGTWRSRKGAVKVRTDRPLDYDTTEGKTKGTIAAKHDRAGPYWDRRLVAAEGDAMVQEIREYIRRREALR